MVSTIKGLIFDIKRYAIHDGPGIRTTVFLKGCPLRCRWCHNPESLESEKELMIRPQRCRESCRVCPEVCSEGAITRDGGNLRIDRRRCTLCMKCADDCVYEAVQCVGREVTAEQLMMELEKDTIFFESSEGGVTLSGGEPLSQAAFTATLLEALKDRGIHTVLDTSGLADPQVFREIGKNLDLILYDIKGLDERTHQEYTGVSNRLILSNLQVLAQMEVPVWIRLPLLSGINTSGKAIDAVSSLLKPMRNIQQINLLPYHAGGYAKYRRLDREEQPQAFRAPCREELEGIKHRLGKAGFAVKIGG